MIETRPFVRDRDPRILAIHPSAIRATYEKREVRPNDVDDGLGIMCIDGPLEHKGGWWFDDYECILQRFKDLMYDDQARAVLLKIDSPGGDAAGLNETVNAMIRCKRETGKPVYAYADEGAYSAAYALACSADFIALPAAGGVGSIGVIAALVSFVRQTEAAGIDLELIYNGSMKADGNPDAPITDQSRRHLQRRVDQLAGLYHELVASSRGLTVKQVRRLNADTFYGYDAVDAGIADDVMSLEMMLTVIRARLDGLRATA